MFEISYSQNGVPGKSITITGVTPGFNKSDTLELIIPKEILGATDLRIDTVLKFVSGSDHYFNFVLPPRMTPVYLSLNTSKYRHFTSDSFYYKTVFSEYVFSPGDSIQVTYHDSNVYFSGTSAERLNLMRQVQQLQTDLGYSIPRTTHMLNTVPAMKEYWLHRDSIWNATCAFLNQHTGNLSSREKTLLWTDILATRMFNDFRQFDYSNFYSSDTAIMRLDLVYYKKNYKDVKMDTSAGTINQHSVRYLHCLYMKCAKLDNLYEVLIQAPGVKKRKNENYFDYIVNAEPLNVADTGYYKVVTKFISEVGSQIRYNLALDVPSQKTATSWRLDSRKDGIPLSFIVDAEGKIAWKGHPMDLEKVLVQFAGGKLASEISLASKEKAAMLYQSLKEVHSENKAGNDRVALKAMDSLIAMYSDNHYLLITKYALLAGKDDTEANNWLRDIMSRSQLRYFDWDHLVGNMMSLPNQPDYKLALKVINRGFQEAETNAVRAYMSFQKAILFLKNGHLHKAEKCYQQTIRLIKDSEDPGIEETYARRWSRLRAKE